METENIAKTIEKIILEKYNLTEKVEIFLPKEINHGDYSTNILLKLYSKYKIDKEEFFNYIKMSLPKYNIEMINSFINFFINEKTINSVLQKEKKICIGRIFFT